MREELIAQYNFLEERIQRCYAGSMITLDFSIQDILEFFIFIMDLNDSPVHSTVDYFVKVTIVWVNTILFY